MSRMRKKLSIGVGLGAVLLLVVVLHYRSMMAAHPVPPASEFGVGPRVSATGAYTATLVPAAPLRTGRMQAVAVRLTDGAGRPVESAAVEVDGGMPQHGHGLPTRPRAVSAGGGTYRIAGLKFNMGGWWEVKLRITGPAGRDSVVFNLDL